MTDWLEEFWADTLSEEPVRITAAWMRLTVEEQVAVRAHLVKMATEAGWAEVQRRAAQAALEALDDAEARA
ncbi:MAG: hypothetical protein M5R40_28870 [Anaerolineae bacterium]|nr:hypothetical protein [Anaerolineae bacterium]